MYLQLRDLDLKVRNLRESEKRYGMRGKGTKSGRMLAWWVALGTRLGLKLVHCNLRGKEGEGQIGWGRWKRRRGTHREYLGVEVKKTMHIVDTELADQRFE